MKKKYKGAEKRKHKRIVFSAKDNVTGVVAWIDHADEPRTYPIADIGAGGMRFILPKGESPKIIDHNDRLFLKKITGMSSLTLVADVELQVRWVIEHEMFDHMVIGCEFVKLPEDVSRLIREFVQSELKRRRKDP